MVARPISRVRFRLGCRYDRARRIPEAMLKGNRPNEAEWEMCSSDQPVRSLAADHRPNCRGARSSIGQTRTDRPVAACRWSQHRQGRVIHLRISWLDALRAEWGNDALQI